MFFLSRQWDSIGLDLPEIMGGELIRKYAGKIVQTMMFLGVKLQESSKESGIFDELITSAHINKTPYGGFLK